MNSNKVVISGKEIRKKFIEFFSEKHGHRVVKSSSLIPDNPTVLLTTAGMLQFVPIFLGYEKPTDPPRAVSVQKCARAGGKDSDIENVGRTPRHHTFFEMLGNFSFGDYFKSEIIPWAWEFITEDLKLDKSSLWITVYETDDEAFAIWRDKVGVSEDRIIRKGKKDNFWGPPGPSGPCGPCSEIHFDFGEQYSCGPDCHISNCECDRFVEIWNLVFMELNQDEEGKITPLEKKNVDTGMGLERITMVMNGVASTFETDLLLPILQQVAQMSGKTYKENPKTDISLRIITDHARCVTFLIADGLKPGNEGRNYVLRMILRRALRHGKLLGIELPFLHNLVDVIVENYGEAYPELVENKDKIKDIVKKEEERFRQTIERGEGLLNEIIATAQKQESKVISGEDAFKLYDTFGFPLELTVEIADEQGVAVDVQGYTKAMAEQKERAKSAHQAVSLTDKLLYVEIMNKLGQTDFIGYNQLKSDNNKVIALVENGKQIEVFEEEYIDIILDKTPFYAESGGQVGDTGIIKSDNFEAKVINTVKVEGLFIHKAQVLAGKISVGEVINAEVDEARRKEITIHHTTAHLMQSALRKVLGDGVAQAGSMVEPDRTRFDFSFDRGMTPDEIKQVEQLINGWICDNIQRETAEMSIDEAKQAGAIALFDEKYGDKVRVVSLGEVSKELCGGTHACSTGDIRVCKITSESAIAAGTRRIEAVCGNEAVKYLNSHSEELEKIAKSMKAPTTEVFARIQKMTDDIRQMQKKLKDLEAELAAGKVSDVAKNAIDIDGGKLLVERIDGLNADLLKQTVEQIADKLGESIVVFASVNEDKISIIAKVSNDFMTKGINAGKIVNEVASDCGGKGGGRPNFAQAGAKDPTNLDKALLYLKSTLA
ncbi:MAG: alanine--tRNA ligase [bacterium]